MHHFAVWTTDYERDVESYRSRGFVDAMWGTASGRADERFVYLSSPQPGPMIEVVEVLAPKAETYHAIASAARDYTGTSPVRELTLRS